MRLKQFIFALTAMLLSFASPSFAADNNVAKVKVDGNEASVNNGVLIIPVADFAALKAAVEAGKSVKLTADITTTAAITTSGVTSVIDLNDKTLTIGAGDNKFNDASDITIKNGTISITGVTVGGNGVFCLDEYEKTLKTTLTLENVNLVGNGYSSAYCIFYIGDLSVLNVKGGEWSLKNDASTAGGVFKSDASAATLKIDGLKLTAHNVRRVVTYAATTIENSTLVISGDADGVDAEMEHGFNRSPLAIRNSTITMTDMVGRGITAQNGAVTISKNSTVTMTNCQEATIDVRNNQTVTIDSSSTVSVDKEPTITSGTISGTVKLPAVAKIGETEYSDFAAALTAASAMSGDVTIEVYDKVTLNTAFSGSYSSINFVGKDTDAEIYLDVQGYITATGKKVSFTDLKLSKSAGGFITNAGFMNVAFGIYDVVEVAYTNCVFANGAYASSGNVIFNGCTFYRSHDKYGLWAYCNVDATVEGCTFADYRGIKMYAEDKTKTTDLTVKSCDFSAVTDKPAIVLTYGESVVLEDNTYSSTGTFELDLDGAPNGTAVTSDVAPTCKNDNGACGVLVDGKIYTTVAQAAEVATGSSTVTLLHSSTETVLLPEGSTLVLNGFTAPNVTVEVSLAGEGTAENPYLIETLKDLKFFRDDVNTYTQDGSNQYKGKYVKLTADIDLAGENWEPIGKNSNGDHQNFLGTFYGEKADGTKPTISNLYINADGDHLGFFARVGSYDEGLTPTVKNIKFNNVDVSSNTTNSHNGSYVAGVIANAGGNSVVSGIEVTGYVYVKGYGYIGGIVGHGYPDIDNCHVAANDGSYINSHYWCVGGIIGYAGEGGTPITNSSVSGVDIWSAYGAAAAIAGLLNDGNKLKNVSASNVDITSNSDYYMGYIAGNGNGSTMTGISIKNVTATAKGNPITPTDAVAKVNDAVYFSLQEAVAAAKAGDEIVLLGDVAEDATLPAGVKFNGNGKAVGNLTAGGEITFTGVTKATSFGVEYTNTTVNIVAGASLEITGTNRMAIGHGCTFNITGNITDAKTADVAALTPSLIIPGASFTGAGVTFNVNNAYIKATAYCSSKNNNANGTFNFNVTNSVWEQGNTLVFSAPTNSMDPTFNLNLVNSVLNSTSHLVFAVTKGKIVIDNSNVNVGTARQIENRSTMTIKNGSVVNGAVATSSNAKNPGTLIVEDATYTVTGEFSGSDLGTGTLIVNKGATVSAGSITKANIQIDATGMAAGDEVNLTADLSKLVGTIEVINNDNLDASIVDGKVVLVAVIKPVAKIGDVEYTSLQEAIEAVQEGETVTVLEDITFTTGANGSTNGIYYTRGASFTLDLNGKTITSDLGNNALRFKIGDGNTVKDTEVTVLIKNGKIVSGSNNWCAISAATADNSGNKLILNLTDLTIEANKAGDFAVRSWAGAVVNAMNVDVTANYAGGFYAVGGEIVLDENSSVAQKGLHTAPYMSYAFGVSSGTGKMTINGGIYSAVPAATTDADNQGASHGSSVGGVMNSGGTLIINGGTFSNDNFGDAEPTAPRSLIMADAGAVVTINGGTFNAMAKIVDPTNNTGDASKNANVTIKGGTYSADPTDAPYNLVKLAEGYAALQNLDGNYVVGVKPTATVNSLGMTTVKAGDYSIWNGSFDQNTEDDGDMPLSFVMQFLADQDAEDMKTSPYANWYGDFVITFTGIENGSFTADGCYLAGHYGSFGWVKVPVDGMTIKEGARYPVMLGVGLGQKYNYICSSVEDFKCALYLTPEILEANPNIQVKLELAVVDNSKGSDAAASALINNDKVYSVTEYTYDAEDFVAKKDPEVVDGKIEFVDGEFNSYTNDTDVENVEITYKRTIDSDWNALYVPFAIPASKLLADFDIAYINDVRETDADDDGELDGWQMELIKIKKETAVLRANHPYFVRSKSADYTENNLSLTLTTTLYKATVAEVICSSAYSFYTIKGLNELRASTEFGDADRVLGYDNGETTWGKMADGYSLKPFRFYLTITNLDGSPVVSSSAQMSIVVRDEDGTTGIDGICGDENGETVIFDLYGRRVLEPEKGNIYIINGKKVLVK